MAFAGGVGNINAFMSIFKQRITDNFVQNWSEQLENSTRANTYKLISDFHFKTYLDFITCLFVCLLLFESLGMPSLV